MTAYFSATPNCLLPVTDQDIAVVEQYVEQLDDIDPNFVIFADEVFKDWLDESENESHAVEYSVRQLKHLCEKIRLLSE